MKEENKDMIKKMNILSDEESIFNDVYIIPIYQRAYSWKKEQIEQMIEDINGIEIKKENKDMYYIGTLVVDKKKDSSFEVIDGQQRLTTLYLLLNYLFPDKSDIIKSQLKFKCRDKSNYMLSNIKIYINSIKSEVVLTEEQAKNISGEIYDGIRIIHEYIIKSENKINKDDFIKKLKQVVIFRVCVPPNTDLNRYFEIMNTRGEQLLQTDIIKARLISEIKDEKDEDVARNVYSQIWDACSDMVGYVQKHITPNLRDIIFGNKWNNYNDYAFEDIVNKYVKKINNKEKQRDKDKDVSNYKFEKVIELDDVALKKLDYEDIDDDEDKQKVSFESIISFEYFLMYIMKYYLYECVKAENFKEFDIDDKKLLVNYKVLKDHCLSVGKDEKIFAKEFLIILLKARYLFDKFIIKRELSSVEDKNGFWSLQKQELSESKNRNLYPKLTFDDKTINDDVIMLQSALRVSYVSPKNMNWFYEVLKSLLNYNDNDKTNQRFSNDKLNEDWINSFKNDIEECMKQPTKDFLYPATGKYEDGVNTPNVVFNYLDYLLWKNRSVDDKYEDFEFQFRNSVEHWYPRNPTKETSFGPWDSNNDNGTVDRFGNLCLVQSNVNSRFSNSSPNGKKDLVKNMNQSLKLREMIKVFDSMEGCTPEEWNKEKCAEHEEKMIKILRTACGI